MSPLSKKHNQGSPLQSYNPQLLRILQILLEPQVFQCSDHLWMLIPPLPCFYTYSKTHSSILRCQAKCCTIINHSNQEHHRNNTSLSCGVMAPELISVRCPLSRLPAPDSSSVQVDLQPLARLSSPLNTAESSVALQNHGWVTGKRQHGADTCAVEVCKVPDTLGGCDLFFFQLLTQPDRSSL